MRLTCKAALAWAALAPACWGQIADEKLAKAECWLIFEGFADTPILSVEAPGGTTARVTPGDVVDVYDLLSLKGATRDHVVRIYELRDGTKFVCRLDRL